MNFDCLSLLIVEMQSCVYLQVVLMMCSFEDVFIPLQIPELRPIIHFVLHRSCVPQQLLFCLREVLWSLIELLERKAA